MAPTTEFARKRSRARVFRWAALLAVLALSTVLGILHQTGKGSAFWVVSVDALCPFGGIEAAWSFFSDGFFLQKLAMSSLVLLVATIGVALVMGRSFCGQVCPLGALQELFARIGRKLFGRRLEMPKALDRPARYLKYVVLAVIAVLTWRAGELVIRATDPWVAYHHLTSPELLTEMGIGAAVLGVSVVGSLMYDRFFCKYACPMGAFLGLMSRFSLFAVRRDADACVDCGRCDKACPVNLEVATADVVRSSECIGCSECVTACPAEGALTIADRSGRRLSPLMLTTITLGIFFGLVAVSTAADQFEWTKPTLVSEFNEAKQSGQAPDTTSIKGWMSMNDIVSGTGISADALQATFGVSPDDMDVPLKELKESYGFSTEDVRAFVAEESAR